MAQPYYQFVFGGAYSISKEELEALRASEPRPVEGTAGQQLLLADDAISHADEEGGKSQRKYNHWTFGETLLLVIQFIELEGLEYIRAQAVFQSRDVHACRVKWSNDHSRFIKRGASHNWKTLLVGVILDFHQFVAAKNFPGVKEKFPKLKETLLILLRSMDYACFVTSLTYRREFSQKLISFYKETFPVSALPSLSRYQENSADYQALKGVRDRLEHNKFCILQEVIEEDRIRTRIAREEQKRIRKIVFTDKDRC